jgi:hypothetical protein
LHTLAIFNKKKGFCQKMKSPVEVRKRGSLKELFLIIDEMGRGM